MTSFGKPGKGGCCELCERETDLSFHHLIPRKTHRRAHFKQHYAKNELGRGISICRLCHHGIHRLYDEMTLAKQFSTKEALLADEAISRHVAWVRKQKSGIKVSE